MSNMIFISVFGIMVCSFILGMLSCDLKWYGKLNRESKEIDREAKLTGNYGSALLKLQVITSLLKK